MDIADPPAPQALDIKLLKKTDPDADKNGIDNAKDDRAPVGTGHQPRQYRKDHDFQQDRSQFASCRNREWSEGKVHDRPDRAYFWREKGTNPSRFGICTFAKVCAFMAVLSAIMPFS